MKEEFLLTLLNKAKRIFIKEDMFREHIEDEFSKVLLDMSMYTTLDEVKATLVQTALTIAVSYTPIVGGVTVALTTSQMKLLSEQVVVFGHKAEKLLADQLAKKDKLYREEMKKEKK